MRELKWVTMDDIQDHWVKFSDDLREKNVVARPLVAQLSEARYNYGSWNKQFKDEDKLIKKKAKLLDLFKKPSSLVSHEEIKHFLRFCWTLFFATILSLIVFVPVFVLTFHYDLVHYEEQLDEHAGSCVHVLVLHDHGQASGRSPLRPNKQCYQSQQLRHAKHS